MKEGEFEGYKLVYDGSGRVVKVINIEDPIQCVQVKTPMPWWLVREVIWHYEYPLDTLESIDEFFQAVGVVEFTEEIESKFFSIFWIFENRKMKGGDKR